MKKMTKFWAFALSGLMFAACSNNDEIVPNPNTGYGDPTDVVVTFVGGKTRANDGTKPGTDEESKIDNARIYVFKSTGEIAQAPSSLTLAGGKGHFTVERPEATAEMKFLVAINTAIELPGSVDAADPKATDYDNVKEMISDATTFVKFANPSTQGNTLTQPATFPMSGWASKKIEPTEEGTSATNFLTINVRRLVSKVEPPVQDPANFKVDIDLQLLKDSIFKGTENEKLIGADFEYLGYTLINGLDKTDAFYTWNTTADYNATWNTWKRDGKTYINSTFNSSGHYTSVYAGSNGTDMFIGKSATDVAYAYENFPKDDPDPKLETDFYDKTTVYSFIIKGTLTSKFNAGEGTPATITRYWKANLISDDGQKVLRNCIYTLTMTGITSVGYGTPKDAEEEPVPKPVPPGQGSVTVTVSVANWDLKKQEEIL